MQDNQGGDGGGMAVSGSEVSLNDMVFVGNTAQEPCQAYDFYANGFFYSGTACSDSGNGGGIVAHASDVDLMDCTLHEGRADSRGGGIHAVDSSLDLTRCRLSSNAADGGAGGGISTMDGTLTLEGCTLSGNSAEREGGGIYADSPATLTHCLLTGNEVESWRVGADAGVVLAGSRPHAGPTVGEEVGRTCREVPGTSPTAPLPQIDRRVLVFTSRHRAVRDMCVREAWGQGSLWSRM